MGGCNLRPLPQSPAIDAGDNSYPNDLENPIEFDRDGNIRIVGDAVDIGAYEYQRGIVEGNTVMLRISSPLSISVEATDSNHAMRYVIFGTYVHSFMHPRGTQAAGKLVVMTRNGPRL